MKYNFIIAAAIVVVLLHFITLSIYPLPWFDEVFMASVAQNYLEEGTMIPDVVQLTRGSHESISYGPVYFLFTGLAIHLGDIGPGVFRLVGLLAGVGSVILLGFIVYDFTKNRLLSYVLPLLLLLDPFFSLSMHQGRMETLVVFLVLAAFRVYQLKLHAGYTSVLLALTYLTTPRSFVLLIPLLLFFILDLTDKKKKMQLIALCLPGFLLVMLWIINKFDTPWHYIDHMISLSKGNKTAVHGYLGFNTYIPAQQYMLLFTVVICMATAIFRQKKSFFKKRHWFILGGIVLFYAVIYDWGPYSVLILPLLYLLTAEVSRYWIIIPLCLFNLTYTGAKFTQIFIEQEHRKGSSVAHVMDQIVANSNVAGDARFYYKAIQNGHRYHLHDQYGGPEENADKLSAWADYVILATPEDHFSQQFKSAFAPRLTFIGEYDYPIVSDFYDVVPLAKNEGHGMSFRLYKVEPPL